MRIGFIKLDLEHISEYSLQNTYLNLTFDYVQGANTCRLWGLAPNATGHDWTEDSITGANRPASTNMGGNLEYIDAAECWGGTYLQEYAHNGTVPLTVAFGENDSNFQDFINQAKRSNSGQVTFILTKETYSNDNLGKIATKEDATEAYRPNLGFKLVAEGALIIIN